MVEWVLPPMNETLNVFYFFIYIWVIPEAFLLYVEDAYHFFTILNFKKGISEVFPKDF